MLSVLISSCLLHILQLIQLSALTQLQWIHCLILFVTKCKYTHTVTMVTASSLCSNTLCMLFWGCTLLDVFKVWTKHSYLSCKKCNVYGLIIVCNTYRLDKMLLEVVFLSILESKHYGACCTQILFITRTSWVHLSAYKTLFICDWNKNLRRSFKRLKRWFVFIACQNFDLWLLHLLPGLLGCLFISSADTRNSNDVFKISILQFAVCFLCVQEGAFEKRVYNFHKK